MSTLFQRRYQENTRLQSVCKMIVNIIMVIMSAYVMVTFMCDRTIISGGSMQPVIENEDTVLINRFAYSFTKPKRYSVAAFKLPGSNSSKVYVKRVIGLPGEKIQIKDGHVYINGMLKPQLENPEQFLGPSVLEADGRKFEGTYVCMPYCRQL